MTKSNIYVIVNGKGRVVHLSKRKNKYYYIKDGKRVYTKKPILYGKKPSSKSANVKNIIKSKSKYKPVINVCTVNKKEENCKNYPCSWTKHKKTPCRMGRGSHQGVVYEGPHLNI